jgi:hypothetical protein
VRRIINALKRISVGIAVMSFCTAEVLALPTITIMPSATSLTAGDSLDVTIAISGLEDGWAYQFNFGFAPAVLRANGVDSGALFFPGSVGFLPGSIDNGAGAISFIADSLAGSVPGLSGSGTLAVIHLLAFGAGASLLSLDNILLLDSNLNELAVNPVLAQTVTVSAVPEPVQAAMLFAGGVLLLTLRCRRRA